MMNKEKGIFTKLLSVAGVILMIVGVFVFQGGSKAEDDIPPVTDNGTGIDGNTLDPIEDQEPVADQTPVLNNFIINYYNGENKLTSENYSGEETEHKFIVIDTIPESEEGEFYAWYDEATEKYYSTGDEIVLTTDRVELDLVAKFRVLKTFALNYDANGGVGAPSSQNCESYLETCDFTISDVVPTKDGYGFVGWQKIDDTSMTYAPGASIRSRSTEDALVLRAVWAEVKTYTLIYEGNGGSGVPVAQECKSATGSCKFVLSDLMPTRASFEFMNWQKGIEVVMPGTEITVTESVTILVANWNPITVFTLEYVAEGAKDLPDTQKCETFMGTCSFIIPEKEPTKEGYIFKGWRLEGKDDMLAKAGDELIVGVDGPLSLKINAIWSKIYTVLNSGEVFGVGERIMLRAGADYSTFKELTIDEEVVPEDYFKVSEGGATSVILSNAFSQSLSAGEHAFKITWEDGEANGIISVNQNEDGTKRFIIVDAAGTTDGMSLMLRPKAGAVSKESTGVVTDSAKDNSESNFDAVRTLIIVAIAVFITVYIVNRFYIRRKMEFIEEF